jgi:hypothetical protein
LLRLGHSREWRTEVRRTSLWPGKPRYIELNTEETPAAFERHARELLDTSGEKFVRRWNAREYDEIADDGEHSENMLLAMFGYGDK